MPADPGVQLRLGQVHAALGETEAAAAAFAAVLDLAGPEAPLARDAQARLDALPKDG
ncbi:hypothetical protein [Jannaschia ovalis]|uniref:hypothetical protein n=1 Tax=Jannaschia ovalis TaxID=3038773 RepID=UPI0038B310A6